MVAALSVSVLRAAIRRPEMRCAVYVAAAALVSLQALGRLMNGSHWLSDVVASVLLAFAWALGANALRRLPHKVTGMILVLASLAFFVFDDLPATRFGLPSALDERSLGARIGRVRHSRSEGRPRRRVGGRPGRAGRAGVVGHFPGR